MFRPKEKYSTDGFMLCVYEPYLKNEDRKEAKTEIEEQTSAVDDNKKDEDQK